MCKFIYGVYILYMYLYKQYAYCSSWSNKHMRGNSQNKYQQCLFGKESAGSLWETVV